MKKKNIITALALVLLTGVVSLAQETQEYKFSVSGKLIVNEINRIDKTER